MKLTKMALASALALGTTVAQADIEGNIAATSDYIWRGQTQTASGAAVSGGLDWSNDSGMYAGIWASNVAVGHEADLYGGYSGEANGVGYDVGVIYYGYLGGAGDFIEIAVSASMGMITVGVNSTVSADTESSEGDLYYYISGGTDVMDGTTLSATLGAVDPDAADGTDFTHVNLSLGKSMGDMGDFALNLDLTSEELAINGTEVDPSDDARISVGWSKGF